MNPETSPTEQTTSLKTSSTESEPDWSLLTDEERTNELLFMVGKVAQLTQLMDGRLDEHDERIKTLELGSAV